MFGKFTKDCMIPGEVYTPTAEDYFLSRTEHDSGANVRKISAEVRIIASFVFIFWH